MNRKALRSLAQHYRESKCAQRGISPVMYAFQCFDVHHVVELSPAEAAHTWPAVERALSGPLYHGGLAGRAIGDFLLPPEQTGEDPAGHGDALPMRRQHVYLTTWLVTAEHYARRCSGVVYRVLPEGLAVCAGAARRNRLLAEIHGYKFVPAAHIGEFTCPRAEVLEVLPCDAPAPPSPGHMAPSEAAGGCLGEIPTRGAASEGAA